MTGANLFRRTYGNITELSSLARTFIEHHRYATVNAGDRRVRRTSHDGKWDLRLILFWKPALIQAGQKPLPVPRQLFRRSRQSFLPVVATAATGSTTYLLNSGPLEHAQQIAAHQSPRATRHSDRSNQE